MIKYAIFDLDDTLLDFKRGEREGLTKIMTKYGVSDLKQGFDTYTKINHQVWQAIEQGQARDALLNTRFSKAFNLLGIKVDGAAVEAEYRSSLDTNFYKLQGVDELLSDLKAAGVHLLVGTNGVKETQLRRLKGSGLEHYFEDYFISEDIGFAKPDKRFFEPMFKKIWKFNDERRDGGRSASSRRFGCQTRTIKQYLVQSSSITGSSSLPTYLCGQFV